MENYRMLMEDTKNKIEKKERQYIMQTDTNDAIIKFRDDLQGIFWKQVPANQWK